MYLPQLKGILFVENSKSKKFLFLNNGETIISTPKGEFFQIETFRDHENIRNSFNQELIPFNMEVGQIIAIGGGGFGRNLNTIK